MIADRQNGRTVQSTLQGEVVRMGIDENAMAHIMNVLTDLYSNPLLAIIREYSTNARDALIEAGLGHLAIEVSTPSALSPFLRVKDAGVGLDADDIRTIYSQYGNSTKRSTNDQVGMLGLGCKSALTYTDNFVVVSVKDGQRVEVSIERTEDGTGVMKMPVVTATTEPNGTEVIVPIKTGDANKASQIAQDFFRFWEPGTVLVNGGEPARIEGLDLFGDGKLLVIDGDQDYVIMGNVAYPVQDPLSINHGLPRRWNSSLSVAAFVGIGDVNFPPSRETLMGTTKTKATLKDLGQKVRDGLKHAVQRDVQQAPTHAEAIRTFIKWEQKLGRGNIIPPGGFTYKGRPMPTSYTPQVQFTTSATSKWATDKKVGMLVTENSSYNLSRAEQENSYPAEQWTGSLFLHGYDLKAVSPSQKRKMRKYVEDNNLQGIRRFVLMLENPSADMRQWLGNDNIKPWADVAAIKLPSKGTAAVSSYGRLPGSYDFYCETGYKSGIAGDQIDQSKPIFYVHGGSHVAAAFSGIMREHYPKGFYIVCLSANRIDKFCRIIPTAKTAKEGIRDLWAKDTAKFTKDELLALHIHDSGEKNALVKLNPANINDPDLVEAIRIANVPIKHVIDKRNDYSGVIYTGDLSKQTWTNPLNKYPLWSALSYGCARYNAGVKLNDPDVYLYLNSKYDRDFAGKGRQVV